MSGGKSLHESNRLGLGAILSANAVAFVFLLSSGVVFDGTWSDLWEHAKALVGGAAIPFIVGLLNGLVSSNVKAALVFWRFVDPLPASRAFTVWIHKDPRIDAESILCRLGPIPETAKEQNAKWYGLFYKPIREDIAVQEAHRQFLFARDFAALSFIMFFLLGGVAVLCFTESIRWYYVGGLAVQFFIAAHSARIYGNRFVCTVLALSR